MSMRYDPRIPEESIFELETGILMEIIEWQHMIAILCVERVVETSQKPTIKDKDCK